MINYNGNLINDDSASLEILNRGFQYGDGIFETIIFRNNNIRFKVEHWERVAESLAVLKIELPFNMEQFFSNLEGIVRANDLEDKKARLKLYIWRKTGGLYCPNNSDSEFLLTAAEAENNETQSLGKVAFGKTVFLQKSIFSEIKTLSALPYVMAGIEKKERKLDELILLSQHGFIAEASASNIYFFDAEKKMIYTPSLESGCVNGVTRRYLFKNAKRFRLNIQEVMWKPEDLLTNLAVFTVNVAGINSIDKVEDRKMEDAQKGFNILREIFDW